VLRVTNNAINSYAKYWTTGDGTQVTSSSSASSLLFVDKS